MQHTKNRHNLNTLLVVMYTFTTHIFFEKEAIHITNHLFFKTKICCINAVNGFALNYESIAVIFKFASVVNHVCISPYEYDFLDYISTVTTLVGITIFVILIAIKPRFLLGRNYLL